MARCALYDLPVEAGLDGCLDEPGYCDADCPEYETWNEDDPREDR